MSSKNVLLLAAGALWSFGWLADSAGQGGGEPGASGSFALGLNAASTTAPRAGEPAEGTTPAHDAAGYTEAAGYFDTRETSILGPVPPTGQGSDRSEAPGPALGPAEGQSFSPGDAAARGRDAAARRTLGAAPQPDPATSLGRPTSRQDAEGDPPSATRPSSTSRLTMWITMGLFASLAANLFFAWVAWDTHAKFRDLVAARPDADPGPGQPVRPAEPAARTKDGQGKLGEHLR